MHSPVSLKRDGDVAVILIDNPPVNALSQAVRAGIASCLAEAAGEAGVKAIVLACAGRTFVAGADITEFGKPPKEPGLNAVIAALEDTEKPVVAAIHGTALGGGLELALGCHARIASRDAKVGLPEVKLGILPGAGGTQRLPRLAGPIEALKMIVSGEPIGAAKALSLGIVDGVVDGDLTAAAIAHARQIAASGKLPPRVRDRQDKLAVDMGKFDAQAASLTAKVKRLEAPQACVESVRNAVTMPFDQGRAAERELFTRLVSGDQSKAQRHLFFAEREALKVPGMPPSVKGRAVAKAAVVGAGTMGTGITMNFANAGIPVTMIDASPEALARGMTMIRDNYEKTAARGGLSAADVEKRLALISGAGSLEAVRDADMVIEAVFEEMDLKTRIFAELDAIAKPGAVLATNTSTLDVDAIAAATRRPADVVGMHFFSPANVMRLLEIVRGNATSFDALATAIAVGRRMGKVGVISGVCDGFIGNRMLARRSTEAERLILEGALPQDVDRATVAFGFPMGPFAMSDLAGIDVSWRIRRARGLKAEVSDRLAEMGRFGQKTGRGYFIYEAGSRAPTPDPEVEAIIVAASKRLGIARRAISDQEIVERTLYPMVNEAARILEEGIAMRPSDIDITWVHGYGFPLWRGGPMHYADAVGLKQVAERLGHFAATVGDPAHRPAPMLAKLAAEGKGFASLARKE